MTNELDHQQIKTLRKMLLGIMTKGALVFSVDYPVPEEQIITRQRMFECLIQLTQEGQVTAEELVEKKKFLYSITKRGRKALLGL